MYHYVNYTSSPEQAEEFLAQSFSDIEPYVQLRLKNIHEKYCSNDSETACFPGSQSGMTSAPLTESHGEESLTLCPEDFLVRTFLQLEKELELKANKAGSGAKCSGWFAKYDRDSCLWKIPQCSLLEEFIEFSETWPRWGTMHDGVCWELTMLELGMKEKESGYLHQDRRWPTPTANEDAAGTPDGKMQWMLTQAVKSGCTTRTEYKIRFPTPCTTGFHSDCKKVNKLFLDGVLTEQERITFRAGNGGQLNPDWVEWLMGWPIGWTRITPITIDWRDWNTDPADTGEIPRTTQEKTNRANRLKAIGNGQVPAVAAVAFTILSEGLIDNDGINNAK